MTNVEENDYEELEKYSWCISPRMNLRLQMWADYILDSTEPPYPENDLGLIQSFLPTRYEYPPEMLLRFRQCFADLRDRLANPEDAAELLACVGDEMAMDSLIDFARDLTADEGDEPWAEYYAPLEKHWSDDDFGLLDELFEDKDFEPLYSDQWRHLLDDPAVAEQLGYANLHPSQWFLPFRP